MNYQTSALWFYKPLYYLITLLSLGFTFFGLSSPLFYIMMAGLILPIVVSMHLHNLSEAGRAWLIKDRSNWIVYVNGIPVEEQRSSLNNPCFASVARLKQFYLRTFIGKLALQLIAVWMLFTQSNIADLVSYKGLAEGTIFCLLLLIIVSTLKTLRVIQAQRWEIHPTTSSNGSQWYQAFFVKERQAQPALGKLCSLF